MSRPRDPHPRHFFRSLKVPVILATGLSCLLVSTYADAQRPGSPGHSQYGQGHPQAVEELPDSELHDTLQSLPPVAKARALRQLQGFSFPGNDVANLRADPRGNIFYVDPGVAGNSVAPAPTSGTTLDSLTQLDVFALHSKPGASRTVYLDMDGFVLTGSVWNSSAGIDPLYMRPYSSDSDDSTFSTTELAEIAETWKRVAEDYAPFDIDVTTEEPASFGPNTGHILVSPVRDANNNPIYNDGYGGVAYVNVWGISNFIYYQPALVFPENLGYSPHNISEAASHELGHNLGLSHDGTSTASYYSGHGSGMTSWAPIMGVGYYAQVTQWSRGEYADANNQQDDVAIISQKLGYSGDDHEDLESTFSTPLVRTGDTGIESTSPVTDPGNTNPNNKGMIEDQSDVDLFYLDVTEGTIDLTVTPAWRDAFDSSDSKRGVNVDLQVSLLDEYGNYVASSNAINDTYAAISVDVESGRYFLSVEGTGYGNLATDGYSAYGSLGQYFISGSVPSDITYTAPPQAPTDVTAVLSGDNSIFLSWTDPVSTPDTNESAYRVYQQKDENTTQLIATLLSNSTSYDDNNLVSGSYVYSLETLNSAGSTWSNNTVPVVIDIPTTATATSELTSMGLITDGSYVDTTFETGFERLSESHQGGKPSNRVSRLDHVWTVTGIVPGAQVTLNVKAQADANSDNDNFQFSYSLDNGNSFEPIGMVENGNGWHDLAVYLPSDTTGTILVKVTDTDITTGNSDADSVDVHYLAVVSQGDAGEQVPAVLISSPADGSSYDPGTGITLAASATDPEDGDLSANIEWSCSQDGLVGMGATVAVSPSSPGEHLISATVTDSAGLTGGADVTFSIIDPNAPTTVSVFSLTGSAAAARNKWNATATVSIVDNHGNPTDGVTVSGTWNGGFTGSGSCITADGSCDISKNNLKSNVASVTFNVTGLTHDILTDEFTGPRQVSISKP